MPATIRLQSEDFDAAAEAALLTRGRTDIGAVVTFSGICRGSGCRYSGNPATRSAAE